MEAAYAAIRRAVYLNDWEGTRRLLESTPDTTTAILSEPLGTVLHVAVTNGNLHFVNQLLQFMGQDNIETVIRNPQPNRPNPVHVAAACGFTEIAMVLVGKDRSSLQIPGLRSYIPVVAASANSHEETTRYLYNAMTGREPLIELDDINGATLLNCAIRSEMYDFAIDLLGCHRHWATTNDLNGRTTIKCLAFMPNAFPSGGQYNICQQWIGSGIKSIHNKKKNHDQVCEILKIVCSQLSSLDEPRLRALELRDSFFIAAKHGIVEIVSKLAEINPDLLFIEQMGKNIFSNAILLRQEKVFNFFWGKRGLMSHFLHLVGSDGNNMLHYAGMLSPHSQQRKMAGVALQMQRELQWFQKVEEIVPSQQRYSLNNEDLTPRELFTKEHRELVKKGEKWMKDTANSCMIVATLIATVTFAAAFTVPGGNNDSGFSNFLRRKSFLLFMISDALSLFSSSTSVLMFLSIYTSRYAEEDFLKSLPKRLIIGLFTLFFSILTMMVAFYATMFLTLGKHYKWAAILVTCLAAVPVIFFIFLQFPLFRDMIHSTYCPGLFSKKHGFKTRIASADSIASANSGPSGSEMREVRVAEE